MILEGGRSQNVFSGGVLTYSDADFEMSESEDVITDTWHCSLRKRENEFCNPIKCQTQFFLPEITALVC